MDSSQSNRSDTLDYADTSPGPSAHERRPSRSFLDTGAMGRGVANHALTMTPPDSPTTTGDNGVDFEEPGLFHNYLRAFYPFDAASGTSGSEESLLMTACIKPGDLILVHSVHANGWADGTVLSTGTRGWIPTNYCEPYDHPYLRNLLNAMTQFWDLLGASEDANLSTFIRQDYIRGLIAGVRHLLEHADCLHRDAKLVQCHSGIRRMRKGLLADLSTLVQIAKRLQDTISESFAGEVIHVLLDDLITKAFKVVTRAVGFADIWTQETSAEKSQTNSPPSQSPEKTGKLAIDTTTSTQMSSVNPTPIDSAIFLPASPSTVLKRGSAIMSDSEEPLLKPRPLSVAFKPLKGAIAHRMSWVEKGKKPQGTFASSQLAKVHDLCISHIGALIGHHLHSRATSELVETTTGLVNACKSMLAIVDEVYSHDPKKSISVQQARLDLQTRLEELIGATRDLFEASTADEDQLVVLPEQSNVLVVVGTELIRTAGDCVVKTRSVIEQIGDFALEDISATASDAVEESEPQENVAGEKRLSKRLSIVESARENRISLKMFPPPPPLKARPSVTLETANLAALSPICASDIITPNTPFSAMSNKNLPSIPQRHSTLKPSPTRPPSSGDQDPMQNVQITTTRSVRKDSVGISIAGSTETINSSTRDSATTVISEVSSRATTPDQSKEPHFADSALLTSFASLSSLQSGVAEVDADAESQLLQRTYASELILNKDGQVTGGSLPALIEQLTTHDAAPDPQFVSAFYVTFRSFTTPRDFAEALSARFDYIGDSKTVGMPVRLRIYNVFKGWLETYWNGAADKDALEDIRNFALQKLKPHLSSAGDRLIELTKKVDLAYQNGTFSSQLVSGVGKSSMSIASTHTDGSNVPAPLITQKQLSVLRVSATAVPACSILDFEPLELARQLTLLASQIFCAIQPEELLEWNKKGSSKRSNVRAICSLNTDVAHVVGDSILGPEDAKRRAMFIKHWAKVATCCLELNNYETLMAIMCSLNSSVVQRLKRTWELVSKKTKSRLDELNAVVDHSKNHASMRRRLETPTAPCLPFLGIYLTDLTFIDAGNPKTRELPGSAASETGEIVTVINFDRHMRTAKVLSHLQKFQVAYKLEPVPELQKWLELHLERMRKSEGEMVTKFHRRSLVVEPKMDVSAYRVQRASSSSRSSSKAGSEDADRPRTNSVPSIDEGIKDKFAFLRSNTFGFKTHTAAHDVHTLDVVPEQEK
nr:uncharacterized protein LOC112019635 [Quercus suber]